MDAEHKAKCEPPALTKACGPRDFCHPLASKSHAYDTRASAGTCCYYVMSCSSSLGSVPLTPLHTWDTEACSDGIPCLRLAKSWSSLRPRFSGGSVASSREGWQTELVARAPVCCSLVAQGSSSLHPLNPLKTGQNLTLPEFTQCTGPKSLSWCVTASSIVTFTHREHSSFAPPWNKTQEQTCTHHRSAGVCLVEPH